MCEGETFRVHDLLQLAQPAWMTHCGEESAWVQDAFRMEPWVVVRRARAISGTVAVGVRGAERHQRWGTSVTIDNIRSVVRPEQLRSSVATPVRQSLPAMKALRSVEIALSSCCLAWGPVGSVGFELASGQPTISPASDLDLALFAVRPIDRCVLVELWKKLDEVLWKLDFRVEYSTGSFSLEEYVREEGRPILVRTLEGPKLRTDPWTANVNETAG